jgi:hypothetical protein
VSTPEPGISTTLSAGAPRAMTKARSSGFCTTVLLRRRRKRCLSAKRTARRVISLTLVSPMNSVPRPVTLFTTAMREITRLAVVPSRTGFREMLWSISGSSLRRRRLSSRTAERLPNAESVGGETLLLDGRSRLLESRCHMHFVPCRLRRTGHGQPVRQEVPILGDYVEKAGSGHGQGL